MLSVWYLIELAKLYIGAIYILNIKKVKDIKLGTILIAFLPLLAVDIWRILHFGRIIQTNYDPFIIVGAALLIMVHAVGRLRFERLLLRLLLQLLVIHFFIQFVELLLGGVVVSLLPTYIFDVATNPLHRMLLGVNGIILVLLAGLIIKKREMKFNIDFLRKRDLVLIIVGLFSFGYFVSTLQFFADGSVTPSQAHIIMASLSSVVVIGIVIMFVSRTGEVKLLKRTQLILEKAATEQHELYEKLLKRDRETRKFRHDFNSYMQQILHKAKDNPELQEYVIGVVGNLKQIEEELGKISGSEIVDLILRSLEEQDEYVGIATEWIGKIPKQLKFSPPDMTVLFSNLLNNAFEAAVRCKEERFVKAKVNVDENKFFLSIENSYAEDRVIRNNRIRTSKEDELNHGYGMIIIQDIVNKYGGRLKLSDKENRFTVEILFEDVFE